MKVTKEKYKQVKNLLKLGVHKDEVADIAKVSLTTVERIRKSDSFENYHELSHKAVPKFYKEYQLEDNDLNVFSWAVIGAITGISLYVLARVWWG